MNNEIKEILEFLSNENYYIQDIDCKFKRLYLDEVKTLLDYITKLQEENERLRTGLNTCQNTVIEVNKECNSLFNHLTKKDLDYKSRNDKALEYINNCPEYLWANVNTKELKNILQGEDKDE